jgi:hypothetical protein
MRKFLAKLIYPEIFSYYEMEKTRAERLDTYLDIILKKAQEIEEKLKP